MSDTDTDNELRAAEATLRDLTSIFVERALLGRQLGQTFNGSRDVYGVLGYPQTITSQQYRERYSRGGIAGRVVDALPKATWRGAGDVYEDEDPETETAFEQEWDALNNQHAAWSTLQRTHILACLGSFSVLLIGAPGELNTELPRGRPGSILYLQPFGGGVVDTSLSRGSVGQTATYGVDVTVQTWVEDVRDPRFGLPLTYQLQRKNVTSIQLQRQVHWTRVVHIPAPGFLDDAVFGPPALEGVWNYLEDLDKVVGGGAEAFWLRANGGMQVDVDKKMQLADAKNTLAALQDQVDAYVHNISRIIRTRGVNINQLGSDVADFKNPADALITLIAGTCGIPKRILTGSEMGELASTQDRDNWNSQVNDCRTSYAYPVILRPFIERLIDYGYMSEPAQWDVMWPDVASMSMEEKLDGATKLAALNAAGETIILPSEVREFLGYEPLTDEQLAEIEAENVERQTLPPTEDEQVDDIVTALRKGGRLSMVLGK